jgi:hypothetical protein
MSSHELSMNNLTCRQLCWTDWSWQCLGSNSPVYQLSWPVLPVHISLSHHTHGQECCWLLHPGLYHLQRSAAFQTLCTSRPHGHQPSRVTNTLWFASGRWQWITYIYNGHTGSKFWCWKVCNASGWGLNVFLSMLHHQLLDYMVLLIHKSMSMEDQWNDAEWRKLKYPEKNTSYCHSIHYKWHEDWPGQNRVLHSERLATNHLSHGTVMDEWWNVSWQGLWVNELACLPFLQYIYISIKGFFRISAQRKPYRYISHRLYIYKWNMW